MMFYRVILDVIHLFYTFYFLFFEFLRLFFDFFVAITRHNIRKYGVNRLKIVTFYFYF
jgi:hypothetical protein